MMAPAAMPPITPAATPHPTQRASAVVGAATDISATAPPAARTVNNFVMDFSQVGLGHQRHAADRGSRADAAGDHAHVNRRAVFRKFCGEPSPAPRRYDKAG